jgi:predicted dehydrogenase
MADMSAQLQINEREMIEFALRGIRAGLRERTASRDASACRPRRWTSAFGVLALTSSNFARIRDKLVAMSPTRREFIAAGGLSATAIGANDSIGMGLIGCGGRGRSLLSKFQQDPACRIAAICDVDQGRLRETGASLAPSPETYTDYRRLLERKDIDAVIVATPDHWHAIPALQAIRAGKDVYLEKPVGHTVEEGTVLVAEAGRSGRIVEVGLQQRSGTLFADAAQLIREGALGKISLVHCLNTWNQSESGLLDYTIKRPANSRAHGLGNPPDGDPPPGVDYDFWLGPAPKRRFNPNRFHWNYLYFWDYSGGMVITWGVHMLDSVRHVLGLGWPRAVTASGGRYVLDDMRETPDTLVAVFDYPNLTVTCSVQHANAFPWGNPKADHGIQILGTKGTMLLTRDGYRILPEGNDTTVRQSGPGLHAGEGLHQLRFLESLRSRKPPVCGIREAHISTASLQLANISYRTGRKIRWDEARQQITADFAASRYLTKEYRKPWALTA